MFGRRKRMESQVDCVGEHEEGGGWYFGKRMVNVVVEGERCLVFSFLLFFSTSNRSFFNPLDGFAAWLCCIPIIDASYDRISLRFALLASDPSSPSSPSRVTLPHHRSPPIVTTLWHPQSFPDHKTRDEGEFWDRRAGGQEQSPDLPERAGTSGMTWQESAMVDVSARGSAEPALSADGRSNQL
ncbi:hypothetical protein VTL71DRAFT_4110 [Oculimacula yallundae]|uniref:Uncharacterized protein n=1 Tax=Oculimacula yallundae TaxID=86028 RepID=A0ABR4C4Y0_9HELO